MAQGQTDQLVDRIRLQRHRVGRAWSQSGLVDRVRHEVSVHPVAWVLGSGFVGFVVLPVALRTLVRAPSNLARLWMRSTLQGGVLHLVQGAVTSLWARAPGTAEVAAVWSDAPLDGEEPPLQASGGPVRPIPVA